MGAPDKAATDGVIYKLTGTWTPNSDVLFYATYSEGFRPGLLNRPGGRTNPAGNYTVFINDDPCLYQTNATIENAPTFEVEIVATPVEDGDFAITLKGVPSGIRMNPLQKRYFTL